MSVYYNEIDPFAAAWLRALIAQGVLPDGEVDTRSIVDVQPADVRGFVHAHFFAGIGGWPYALQLAGWPADRPLWTGSCPCQPFSAAGAQAGGDDARDLWPAWARLIRECRPDVVVGEQVEAAVGHGWLDRVCDDLEREGYALGAVCLPAACVGAFHLRQRLWFVADADTAGCRQQRIAGLPGNGDASCRDDADGRGATGHLGDAARGGQRSDGRAPGHAGYPDQSNPAGAVGDAQGAGLEERERAAHGPAPYAGPVEAGAPGDVADPDCALAGDGGLQRGGGFLQPAEDQAVGFWSAVEWIPCRDGKARPVEPGTFPLAHGIPGRVGRLRGYGNAIVPQVAAEVLRAYLEVKQDPASGEAW